MQRLLIPLIFLAVLLTACQQGGGEGVSSRPPKGNPNSGVLVEEFADLQCPACRAAHDQITKPLLEKYANKIRFELKHFPLRSIHRFALDAAEMSECVADQGKFWEFVDLAYEKQPDLTLEILPQWAEEVGVDAKVAEKCWKSHSKRSVVLEDYKEGREREVGGTPTFFVNGEKIDVGMDTLSAAIDAALGATEIKL